MTGAIGFVFGSKDIPFVSEEAEPLVAGVLLLLGGLVLLTMSRRVAQGRAPVMRARSGRPIAPASGPFVGGAVTAGGLALVVVGIDEQSPLVGVLLGACAGLAMAAVVVHARWKARGGPGRLPPEPGPGGRPRRVAVRLSIRRVGEVGPVPAGQEGATPGGPDGPRAASTAATASAESGPHAGSAAEAAPAHPEGLRFRWGQASRDGSGDPVSRRRS